MTGMLHPQLDIIVRLTEYNANTIHRVMAYANT